VAPKAGVSADPNLPFHISEIQARKPEKQLSQTNPFPISKRLITQAVPRGEKLN
jgi:hypothetical protein